MRIVQLHKLEYKYLAILCSYLDWFNQSAARTTLLYISALLSLPHEKKQLGNK